MQQWLLLPHNKIDVEEHEDDYNVVFYGCLCLHVG
jgi:hypothetical protein